MLLWPSSSWMVKISVPASTRWVAKQWRRVCTETGLSIAAFFLLFETLSAWNLPLPADCPSALMGITNSPVLTNYSNAGILPAAGVIIVYNGLCYLCHPEHESASVYGQYPSS